MRKLLFKSFLIMTILFIVFLTIIIIGYLQEPRPSEEIETIGHLKGPEWSRYVGKTVTVEGIFVRDPLPMLVTDLDIVIVNMPMPKEEGLTRNMIIYLIEERSGVRLHSFTKNKIGKIIDNFYIQLNTS